MREETDLPVLGKSIDQHRRRQHGCARYRQQPAAHDGAGLTRAEQHDAVDDGEEHQVEEDVDRDREEYGITEPRQDAGGAAADERHEQHGQPDGQCRADRVGAPLGRHVVDAGEQDADDPGDDGDPATEEQVAEHHCSGDRDTDGHGARESHRQLGCPEQVDPKVQEEVVGPVHRIDAPELAPQRGQRTFR